MWQVNLRTTCNGIDQQDCYVSEHAVGDTSPRRSASICNPLYELDRDFKVDITANCECFYDIRNLRREIQPFFPILDSCLRRCKDKYEKVTVIEHFFETFSLDGMLITVPTLVKANVESLSEQTEACFYALDTKYRERMLDFKYGLTKRSAGGDVPMSSVMIYVYPRCQYDSDRLIFRIGVTWDLPELKPVDSEMHIRNFNGTTVAARALIETLGTVLDGVMSLRDAFDNYMGLSEVTIYYGKVERSDIKELERMEPFLFNTNPIVTSLGVSTSAACDGGTLKENVFIAGSQDEINMLQGIFDSLQIRTVLDGSNTVLLSEDDYERGERSAVARRMFGFGGGNGRKYSYGMVMFLVWVCTQGYYMSSWKGFSSMTDWLGAFERINPAECLDSVDCYGAVDYSYDTFLITSIGFLRLRDGTIENPKELERVELQDFYTFYDLPEHMDEFKREARHYSLANSRWTQFAATDRYKKGSKQLLLSRIVARVGYCYHACIMGDEGNYRVRWAGQAMKMNNGRYSGKSFMDVMEKGLTTGCFRGTDFEYKTGDDEELNETLEVTMCEVMGVLGELLKQGTNKMVCVKGYGSDSGVVFVPMSEALRRNEAVIIPQMDE